MLNVNKLPSIQLDTISDDVTTLLENNKIDFKNITDAPWFVRLTSHWFNETYLAYLNTVYVPEGHIAMAQSKEPEQRIIATSKLLPWVYAIKNGSVSSKLQFLHTVLNSATRCYYFLFEYALLKSHELSETPELVATGFISSRRNFIGLRKNPDKLLTILKTLLKNKIIKVSV
jgi:hypothetical protein